MPSAFLNVDDEQDTVWIAIRFEGDDGTEGDAFFPVRPGESYAGLSYQQLVQHGSGEMALPSFTRDRREGMKRDA